MKKRKSTSSISYKVINSLNIREPKPLCFNSKEDYCRKELCEEWYDDCARKEDDDFSSGCDRTCQIDG